MSSNSAFDHSEVSIPSNLVKRISHILARIHVLKSTSSETKDDITEFMEYLPTKPPGYCGNEQCEERFINPNH